MKTLFAYAFTLAAVLNAPVVQADKPLDVPSGHWAAGAVQRLASEKIMDNSKPGQFQGNKPVTRYELAVTLDRLVRYVEAGRKPLTVTHTRGSVKVPASADVKTSQALTHLVQGGFIAKTSPLLQTNQVVTAQELTSVLSQVVIRLSDHSLPVTPH